MNEYAAVGMYHDAHLNGRRIVVVVARACDIRPALAAFEQVESERRLGATTRRSAGTERIDFPRAGRIWFTTPRSTHLRGMAVDVVFIDNGALRAIEGSPAMLARFRNNLIGTIATGGRVVHS